MNKNFLFIPDKITKPAGFVDKGACIEHNEGLPHVCLSLVDLGGGTCVVVSVVPSVELLDGSPRSRGLLGISPPALYYKGTSARFFRPFWGG